MKKTTKILLVLAAVVAMTIGAVSTVMAADDVVIATWDGDEKNGYTAKDADGNAIKDTWAVAESGIWYYFDNSGEMVANEFIPSDAGWYYVGKDGAMATGWVEFTDKEDDDAILAALSKAKAKTILTGEDDPVYGESVWAYFGENGIAVEDAFLQAPSGLWYYMDEVVMVAGDYSYYVEDEEAYFGFALDGHMYVGWEELFYDVDANEKTPIGKGASSNSIGWVYYDEEGKMYDKEGWKKFDAWYYFVAVTADSRFVKSGILEAGDKVILQDTYMAGLEDGKNFAFGPDGRMYTGATNLSKVSVGKTQFLEAASATDYTAKKEEPKVDVYFDDATGAQKFGLIGDVLYNGDNKYTACYILKNNEYTDEKEINFNEAVPANVKGVVGQKLSNVLVKYYKDNNNQWVGYFDANGRVMNKALTFAGLTICVVDGKVVTTNGDSLRLNGRKYYISNVNGALKLNGATVAYGASTDATEDYSVVVTVEGLTDSTADKALKEAIIKKLETTYAVGEKVSYSFYTKDGYKFESAKIKYGTTTTANQNGKINQKLDFAFPNLGEVTGDVELIVKVTPVKTVKYNGTTTSYAVGEKVTITAPAGKMYENKTNAITGPAVATIKDLAYVKANSDKTIIMNQLTFTMPNNDLVLSDDAAVVAGYAVAVPGYVIAQNMYAKDEVVTVTIKDAAENDLNVDCEATYDKTGSVVYGMYFDPNIVDGNDKKVTFAAIAADITVAIETSEKAKTGDLYLAGVVTKAAIKVNDTAKTASGTATLVTLAAIKADAKVVISNIPVVTDDAIQIVSYANETPGLGVNIAYTVEVKDGKATVTFNMPGEKILIKVVNTAK